MNPADTDAAKIPTLTDLVQPGSESAPRAAPEPEPAPETNEAQLDIPLDTPRGTDESTTTDTFDDAIAEAGSLMTAGDPDALEPVPARIDIQGLMDALEPRIEALVDEALERQARQTRDEIVSSIIRALHDELDRDPHMND